MNGPGNFQQGAVWVCNTISLYQSFKLNFKANFGADQLTGDGIAFVLQGEGLDVLGGTGGGMGYAPGNPINCQGGGCPIDPSVSVEFDTYNGSSFGDNDIPCNHSSIQIDGSTSSSATISGPSCLLPSGNSVVDGNDHEICITWNPFALQYRVYFDDALVNAYNGDIRTFFTSPSAVYWGFTSSSGGATQIHSICEIDMQTSIPSPTCVCSTPNLIITDPPAFCGIGNITDASITAGSESGNLTYWNNASCTNPVTNPNLLFNSGIFYIQLETTPGCTFSQAVNLTVNNSVTPSFTNIPYVCEGEPINLPNTSLNGIEGSWSPAPNNLSTTTYTFTPNPDECAGSASMTIVVREAPSIEPIGDLTLCEGDDTNFSAVISGLGTSISWSAISGSFSDPTNVNTTYSPSILNGNVSVTAIVSSSICTVTAEENIIVSVNPANTIPTFSPIADICSGDALSLPGTSTNSISGTWSPAVNNTATTNYTFTPNAGQCATTQGLTVTVNQEVGPIFTQVLATCTGDAIVLPSTSTNNIVGSWSPAINNTSTTTYTFTPDAGQCASDETMTVDVTPETIPNFSAIADICSGDALSLPGTSTNSISGTWTPAVNNTATTNYTFTPNAGQCATTQGLTVNVNAQTTPSFSAIADICSGDALSLPGTSTNSISGTWTPAVNNTATTNYTFTPNAGQCATTQGLTVNVNAQTTPSFSAIADICSGDALSLPGTSTNSISGTWTPAVNNTATTNYTFTPNAGQCATTQGLTVNVNAQTTPSFSAIADICSGDALSLPGTSTNSISGTWTPAVNNTATTNYTFTPNAGQCATTQGLTVNVNAQTTPSFSAIADICSGDALSLPGTSTNSISGTWTPAVNNTATTNYTFTPNAGQCATTQGLTVNVNAQTTPSFSAIADICSGDALSLPGTSTNSISGTWTPAVNNTATTNYTFTPNAGQCATTQGLTVNVNAQTTPSFSAIADICSGDALSLPGTSTNSISGTWTPAVNNTATTNYTFTPNAGQCATTQGLTVNVNAQTTPSFSAIADICSGDALSLPGTSTNSISGTWTPAVNNTATTNYTFTPNAGQCATTQGLTVNVNAQTTPSFSAIADICSGDALSLPGTSTNSISGTWTPAVNNTATTNYTFTPNAGQCATTQGLTVNVNAQTTPSFSAIADICSGDALSLPGTSTNSISGTWTPAVNNTATTNYTFTPNAGQCATTQGLTVNVNLIPQFTNSVLSDPSSCGGNDGSIVINGLSASSAYDLTYNDGTSNIGPLSITTDASGTYILGSITAGSYSSFIIADANCSFTVVPSLSLTDPSAPVFTSNSVASPSVCGGSDGEISLTGLVSNATYDLTYLDDGVSVGPITINSDASGIIALTGLNSGNYSSFVLDLSGCTGTDSGSITLTDPSAPELQITDPSAVCSPGTVDISVAAITSGSTGGGTLTYWTDASATTPLADQSAVGVSGMYYIQSESNGCTDIEAVNVVVNETPVVQITDPSAVCSPGTVDISVAAITSGSTGGGTLTYWTDASATTPLADQSAVGVSGMYYIQSESNGCTDIEAVNVVVNETPVVQITDPSAVCSPGTVDISVAAITSGSTGGGTLTYWTDASATTPLADQSAVGVSGMYYIQSESNGCTDIEAVNVVVNETPVVQITDPSAVCSPGTVDISVAAITSGSTGGGTLTYWTDASATTPLADQSAVGVSGMYYIQSESNGCTDIEAVNVVINSLPQFTNSVLSDPSSCGGNDGSIVINGLIASSAYDLTYNDGTSNIGPLSITTDASGTYILGSITAGSYSSFIIADANCSFTVVPSLSLTDPSAPVFTSNSVASPSVCGGSDGEISLTGLVSNATYDLTYLDDGVSVGPITINSDASGIIALTGLNSGNYSSFVLDLSGCTGSTPGSITLTDPPAPELQITDPSAVCSPGTVDISVAAITSGSTGGGTLTYWTDASATTPLADQSAVGVSGMYYIQSESNGCTDIEAVNVVVNETPVVQITDPSAVCSPGTVDISVAAITSGSTGGGTLTYWTDASATTPLADQSAVGVSGIYYIQSESNGCIDIEAVNVLVNETPSFTVSGTDPSVCNASDGFITIDGLDPSTDYTLSYDSLATTSQTVTITSDATGAFILNGFEAGLYDAFSITLNGCAFTAVESIDLNNPSAPSIVLQLDTVVCDTYSLGEITGDNLSGNEAYYSQSNGAGISLNAGDVITASQTVYIYDIIGACSDEASFTLTVNNTPELTNLTAQEACVSFELPTTIEGTNLSGNQNYYDAAQANGGALLTGPITTSQQVYMYDANGTCSDEVFFEVSINSLPEVVSFSGEGTYCEGETVESLTAALSGSGVLTLDYTIDGVSNSMNTSTASIDLGTAPGVYVLTQITDENCNNAVNLTQTITINTLPTAPNTSADVSYCANEQPDAMEADGSSGSYTWYADQELTDVLGSQTTYTPETILGSTSYYVTATENGCEGPAQMILIAFEECGIVIPTAFTPDGDQTNDTWSLNDIDVIYPNNVVSVYNRLGNKVYESIQGAYDQMPWDGTFNGEPLPVASYYFIIEYNDNTTPKSNGIVSIIK